MPEIGNDAIGQIAQALVHGESAGCDALLVGLGSEPVRVIWQPELGDLQQDPLRFLLEYWTRGKGVAGLAPTSIVRPERLAPALGYIMLLEVLDGGLDFRYRVYGSRIAEVSGFDMTGKRTSELRYSAVSAFFLACYRAVLIRRQTLYTEHTPPVAVSTFRWHRLIMPLVDEEDAIVRFLVGNVPGAFRATS